LQEEHTEKWSKEFFHGFENWDGWNNITELFRKMANGNCEWQMTNGEWRVASECGLVDTPLTYFVLCNSFVPPRWGSGGMWRFFLLVIFRSSGASRHSPLAIRHSSFVIRHSPFAIRHSSFVIRHSPLAIRH
jgi:hypothetical protein